MERKSSNRWRDFFSSCQQPSTSLETGGQIARKPLQRRAGTSKSYEVFCSGSHQLVHFEGGETEARDGHLAGQYPPLLRKLTKHRTSSPAESPYFDVSGRAGVGIHGVVVLGSPPHGDTEPAVQGQHLPTVAPGLTISNCGKNSSGHSPETWLCIPRRYQHTMVPTCPV